MTFTKAEKITVYRYSLETREFLGAEEYQTEIGFGLPRGLTTDPVSLIPGKVAFRNADDTQWIYYTDDRGQIYYDKQNGDKYATTVINEKIDRRRFTRIAPPAIDDGQLLRFVDSSQSWEIGFDWYELPIWNAQQEMSYYTGEFFTPDENQTNIEPMPHEAGFTLNERGEWVEPEPEQPEE